MICSFAYVLGGVQNAGPGTSPTPISTTEAFIYAPPVYVDAHPQDPADEYQARGMTLITITAPSSGPVATRQGDLTVPGTHIAFGGFATLLGFPSTADPTSDNSTRDIYLLGAANNGLQMARVSLDNAKDYSQYSFFDQQNLAFTSSAPDPNVTDIWQIYLPGSFSYGGVFYSEFSESIRIRTVMLIKQRPILQDIAHGLHEQASRFNFLYPLLGLEPATRYVCTVDFVSIVAC